METVEGHIIEENDINTGGCKKCKQKTEIGRAHV